MKSCLRVFLLLPLLLSQAIAGLTWSKTEAKLTAQPTDPSVEGTYPFKNETDKTITIKDIKSSCGCTTAKLEKRVYAPGESGQIVAHFDIAGRVGPQHKTITITTADEPDKPTLLELEVDIPDPIEIDHPLLVWKVGETPVAQTFTLKTRDGFKVKVTDIRCSTASFSAKLSAAKEGERYDIEVTPAATDKKGFGLLIVTTDFPPKNPRVIYSQLQIQ